MMVGSVAARHALLPLTLRGPNGQAQVDFIIDTGFAGFLTLSQSDIDILGLDYSHPMSVHLADGSRILVDVYRVLLLWDATERDVEVLATGEERLLGTSLLDGYEVHIRFVDQGLVTLESL